MKNQRGDTIIEVIIATVIIGTVLFSAYTLSARAFRLGQSARERTQAAQLLQEQAEGLISLRDRAVSWDQFKGQFLSEGGTIDVDDFHVQKNSNQWALANGTYTPSLSPTYTITIDGNLTGADEDLLEVAINITWQAIGGGPDETSTLYLHLTDQQLPIGS